jgi:hypothetical protein
MIRTAASVFTVAAAAALVALYLFVLTPGAEAGALVVDRSDDDASASACTPAPNDCSLRGAITNANMNPGPDLIQVPNNTYTLTIVGANEDANATGDLDITDDLMIDGGFMPSTIIQAGMNAMSAIDRNFHVLPGASLEIQNVTIRNGTAPSALNGGAGILTEAPLIIRVATVSANSAGVGGGISLVGPGADLEMYSTTVSGNTGTFGGGGIYKEDNSQAFLVENSTISMNAGQLGGGMFVGLSSSAQVINSTIANNEALEASCGDPAQCFSEGGGIYVPAEVLEITGGSVSNNTSQHGDGGGIRASGLIMQGTQVSGNTADNGGSGGGIYIVSFADIDGATITGNHASGDGGGLFVEGASDAASPAIANTAITNNTADGNGGGLVSKFEIAVRTSAITGNAAAVSGGGFFLLSGTAEIENSTVSGNSAGVSGGGVARGPLVIPTAVPAGGGSVPGALDMSFLTIANNTAPTSSGVHDAFTTPPFTAHATIIAGNSGSPNCAEPLDSNDRNIEDEDSCGLDQPFDRVNTNPMISPLTNNGGSTETHALMTLSPAVDAGGPLCPPPFTDQRGSPRPVGNGCDVGAYESPFAAPTPSGPPTATPTPSPTPTPTPTPTATATPTPSPTDEPGPDALWGDDDCNLSLAATDALKKLQDIAAIPYNVEPGCPMLGSEHVIGLAGNFGSILWGDTDCDGDVDAVDALQILRELAGLTTNQQPGCPEVGLPIRID